MRVQLSIPVAGSLPDRDRLHRWCLERWKVVKDAHGWTMCFATDDGTRTEPVTTDVFNHARAINHAVGALGFGEPDDVLVIADADTFPNLVRFGERIDHAREGRWSCPLRYVNLSQPTTERVSRTGNFVRAAEEAEAADDHVWEGSASWAGIVVCRRDQFDAVGGYDERFTGWSADDIAFAMAMESINGPVTRLGTAYHLYHDAPKSRTYGRAGFDESWALTQRYIYAHMSEATMRELLAEREVR